MFGSYLHGIFDSDGVAAAIVSKLCEKKGVQLSQEEFNLQAYKEAQYDKLAALIRKSLDMKKVYEILENGI